MGIGTYEYLVLRTIDARHGRIRIRHYDFVSRSAVGPQGQVVLRNLRHYVANIRTSWAWPDYYMLCNIVVNIVVISMWCTLLYLYRTYTGTKAANWVQSSLQQKQIPPNATMHI